MNFDFDIRPMLDPLLQSFPNIAGSVVILVAGWLVALLVRAIVNRTLGTFKVNSRASALASRPLDIEKPAGTIAFYFILAIAFIGFFNTLNLTQVSAPLQSMVDQVMTFLPSLVAGGMLLLAAWLLAILLSSVSRKALERTTLDERLSRAAGVRPVGAVAVAFALSFGLGGRDAASKQIETWVAGRR